MQFSEKLENIIEKFNFIEAKLNLPLNESEIAHFSRQYSELKPVVEKILIFRKLQNEIKDAEALRNDPDLGSLAEEELVKLKENLKESEKELLLSLIPKDETDNRDVVLVSGAAGSTGSVVGQIAKIMGCRVIGTAGGSEKCKWLIRELGFDAAIDYKSEDLNSALKKHCPNGVNIVFDNVGGEFLSESLLHIAEKARIVLCGAISSVGKAQSSISISNYMSLVIKRAKMEGFISMDFIQDAPPAIDKIKNWINEGKLIYREDIVEGLENAPSTLLRLFSGKNRGKQLLKLADPE